MENKEIKKDNINNNSEILNDTPEILDSQQSIINNKLVDSIDQKNKLL